MFWSAGRIRNHVAGRWGLFSPGVVGGYWETDSCVSSCPPTGGIDIDPQAGEKHHDQRKRVGYGQHCRLSHGAVDGRLVLRLPSFKLTDAYYANAIDVTLLRHEQERIGTKLRTIETRQADLDTDHFPVAGHLE